MSLQPAEEIQMSPRDRLLQACDTDAVDPAAVRAEFRRRIAEASRCGLPTWGVVVEDLL